MTLGVIISKLLGLDNYASSAILVVLCIKHKSTFATSDYFKISIMFLVLF